MFERTITGELNDWLIKKNRKPLVIRGARQVGKTTAVNQFANRFEQYLYLNLELIDDRRPFEQFVSLDTLLASLFFEKKLLITKKYNTLIFIDEIQEVPGALNVLRYFYELEPTIAVIAAGSMLEALFNKNISFPVGRVEYKMLRPVSFPEFLLALNEPESLAYLQQIPAPSFVHPKLLRLFHRYALVGGMPDVVRDYSASSDLTALSSIYDSLLNTYFEDVEKYAESSSQVQHLRLAIGASFSQAGTRIRFEGFGNSSYRSREMAEALRTLEKALLISLVYPSTSPNLPLLPDHKKSPRLQVLDTGMLTYFAGIQKEVLNTSDLNAVYQGTLIEHLVGQELLATQFGILSGLHFWVKEKKGSTAEVDFLWLYDGKLIPIEVKSGTDGTLRSLHQYMEAAPHKLALRFYSGEIRITHPSTPGGTRFKLLSLPYYLVSQTNKYLQWMEEG